MGMTEYAPAVGIWKNGAGVAAASLGNLVSPVERASILRQALAKRKDYGLRLSARLKTDLGCQSVPSRR